MDPKLVPCEKDYDHGFYECIKEKRRFMNTSCILPFENIDIGNKTICTTDSDGYRTIKKLPQLHRLCPQKCLKLNIKTEEIPLTYLTRVLKRDFVQGLAQKLKMKPAYYFNIPTRARQVAVTHDYGFISFIAEFGGWSGIFVGASVISLLVNALDFNYLCFSKENCKQSFIRSMLIVSFMILLYLSYTCVVRFLDEPTGVNVDFENTRTDFDFTICAPKYPFEFQRGERVSETTGNK